MFEDRLLLHRLKRGDKEALRLIYEKYEGDLFTLAATLLNDRATAEDVLQEVFISFAQSVHRLNLRGSLKAYLATAVANRVRDQYRIKARRQFSSVDEAGHLAAADLGPAQRAVLNEQVHKLRLALAALPDEQREAIVLRLQANLRFREIARHQNVSIKTALSRYHYGLEKLRSALGGEVQDESE
jgi:RNA polymerase sigma factor (sigma-70 family)